MFESQTETTMDKTAKWISACAVVALAATTGCSSAPEQDLGTDPTLDVPATVSAQSLGPLPNVTIYRAQHYTTSGSWPNIMNHGDAILTADPSEITRAGYVSDGPIGQCWSTSAGGSRIPLYRIFIPS